MLPHRTGLENSPKSVARKILGTRHYCTQFLKHSHLLGSETNQHLHYCKAQFVLKPCKMCFNSQASPQHPLAWAPSWTTEGYKECSILPTLLMTLFSLFCMSSRRLYQLSDSEVTSPINEKRAVRGQHLADPRTTLLQLPAGREGQDCSWRLLPDRAGTRVGRRRNARNLRPGCSLPLTYHAVDRAKENGALCWCGRLAQVLHDQGAVTEDIDKLSQVGQPHLLQVLALLVSRGSTASQSTPLSLCGGRRGAPPNPISELGILLSIFLPNTRPIPPAMYCYGSLPASPPVLLAHKQVESILCSQEVVVVQDLYGTHPVWIEVPGNLQRDTRRGSEAHLHPTQQPHL